MSYTYLQESGEESSAASFSDIEQSVLLNLNLTADESYSKGNETESCQSSRSGTMSPPSTANLGAEKSMLFAEDSHAKTSQQQEKELVSQENEADSGQKWPESLAKYNQDSRSWRTAQCLLFEDLGESLETFPRWGMMRDGELWELPMSAHLTEENESGLWPTPATKGYGHAAEGMVGNLMKKIEAGVISKQEAEQMLSLPHLENHRTWRKKWGTPKAQDSRHALTDRGKSNLGEQVAGLHNGGKLNPNWVEWLMGWPIGWTDLKPLEMDKFQQWQQQHSEFLKENK